jgi:hypothetical protein
VRFEPDERVQDAPRHRPPAPRGRGRLALDLGIALALAVIAFLNRRGGLPEDGLWFDDSWVAAGAIEGSLGNLMTVGSGHPSLTAFFMAWSSIVGADLRAFAYPALFVGAIGPAVLFLALRRFGYGTAVSAVLGAALAASDAFILYSGRVKGYVIDPILILGIMLVLPRLARTRWRWPLALGWTVAAVVLGGFSGYLLVVTAGAGLLLVVHATKDDRLVRMVSVGAQGVLQLIMLIWAQRSTDLAEIEATQEVNFDGHLTFHANPIRMAQEIHLHVLRVLEVYPGGSGRWLTFLFAAALIGLVLAAWSKRPSEAMRGQLGLFVVAVALVGGVLGRFPFGTTNANPLSLGGRHSMWLMPVIALGLAALTERLLARAPRPGRLVASAALVGVGVMVLARGAFDAPLDYPLPGSAQASAHVEDELAEGDVVLVTQTGIYAFLIETGLPATLQATPERMIGFMPIFDDRRIRTMGSFGEVPLSPEAVAPLVARTDRVLVHIAFAGFGNAGSLDAGLVRAGFERTAHRSFDYAVVDTWERVDGSAE